MTSVVRDTGVGFPADVDYQNTETLGLQIVKDLVKQLNGTVEMKRQRGTEFTIVFA